MESLKVIIVQGGQPPFDGPSWAIAAASFAAVVTWKGGRSMHFDRLALSAAGDRRRPETSRAFAYTRDRGEVILVPRRPQWPDPYYPSYEDARRVLDRWPDWTGGGEPQDPGAPANCAARLALLRALNACARRWTEAGKNVPVEAYWAVFGAWSDHGGRLLRHDDRLELFVRDRLVATFGRAP